MILVFIYFMREKLYDIKLYKIGKNDMQELVDELVYLYNIVKKNQNKN